jgi:hypothetical protein
VKQIRRSGQYCQKPGHTGNADALPSGTLARPAEHGVISNQSILTGGILHVTSFLVHYFPARGPRQQGRPCRYAKSSGPFNNSRAGGGGRVAAAGRFLDLLQHRQRPISTMPICAASGLDTSSLTCGGCMSKRRQDRGLPPSPARLGDRHRDEAAIVRARSHAASAVTASVSSGRQAGWEKADSFWMRRTMSSWTASVGRAPSTTNIHSRPA